MAIINCNDDSFYAPSRASGTAAVKKALQAEADGAAIIDFGAESSRPGAHYISVEEEMERLIPVIAEFRQHSKVPVSVDTRKAAVAKAALESGADIINDISAGEDDPEMVELCAHYKAGFIVMHKKGNPHTMQDSPHYNDVLFEVSEYLRSAAARAESAGIPHEHIILDPGIGFGKRTYDNLTLIRNLESIRALGYPVLVGLSRKTFIGDITGRSIPDRLSGTLASTAVAMFCGADIIRVHDVHESVDAAKMIHAFRAVSGNRAES